MSGRALTFATAVVHNDRSLAEDRVNSSQTWKSGEIARVPGSYRCQNCHLAGREHVIDIEAGKIFPMCETSPDKDVTWRLIRAGTGVRKTA